MSMSVTRRCLSIAQKRRKPCRNEEGEESCQSQKESEGDPEQVFIFFSRNDGEKRRRIEGKIR